MKCCNMEKIICPICGLGVNKLFCEKNNHKIYNCGNCDIAFVWPIPDNLKTIYQESYFKNNAGEKKEFGYADYDKDKEPMKEVFNLYLKKISGLANGKKIFDIGAATGYFLDLAKEKGWQTSGIEISEFAANEAKKRGHNVFCGNLPELDIKGKYDVITMWDVLEHFDSPKKYLFAAFEMLNPDGLLVINTIDKNSWWAKVMGRRWQLIVPPEHLFYYSPKGLQYLLEQSGFEIKEMNKIGKKFSLAYIFKMLYNWQGLNIWKNMFDYFDKPFWRKFSIPINLRDNIFVIAVKAGKE